MKPAKTYTMPTDKYFWTEERPDLLLGYLNQKVRDYYQFLQMSGLFWVMQRAHNAYYGGRLDGSNQAVLFQSSGLTRLGKQGELIGAQAGHFSNVLDHTVQLATATKPAFQGRATNADSRSMAQAILGTSIVDYYWRERGLSQLYVQGTQNSLLAGEAAIHRPWDKGLGNSYVANPESGTVVKEGDLRFELLSPLEVIRETNGTPEGDWYITKSRQNRWGLIARNPGLKEQLLAVPSIDQDEHAPYRNFFQFRGTQRDPDGVSVWTAYHRKTDAVPNGRLVVYTGDVKLYDGPTPYGDEIPIDFIRPRRLGSTAFGFSPMWAVLGTQQIIDILTSTIVTNQSRNGVTRVWTKNEDPVTYGPSVDGVQNLMSETEPRPISLVATPAEVFNFRQEMIGEMETLSGINSTVRGNPEASLKSGNSLALIVAQATQFSGMLEASLQSAQEDTATGIITSLRSFSRSKRVANIIGAANRPFRKEFIPETDLAAIERVVVEPVNPLSKTVSGCLELANNLTQQGLLKTAEQYLVVLQTGRLDPALESSGSHEMLNIRAEGERLRDGKPVQAIISDKHLTHIREHLALLATPEAREDPEFTARVLQHVADHEDKWAQLSRRPALMMATGQQPEPPPPQPASATPDQVMTQQQPPGPGQDNLPGMPDLPQLPANAPQQSQQAYEKATANVQQPA